MKTVTSWEALGYEGTLTKIEDNAIEIETGDFGLIRVEINGDFLNKESLELDLNTFIQLVEDDNELCAFVQNDWLIGLEQL